MCFRFRWVDPEQAERELAGEQGAYVRRAVMPPRFRAALERLAADLAADPDVLVAVFFRSAQRGASRAYSDLDVAVVVAGERG